MPFPCRNLSVSIARPPDEVYAFVADPRNLPKWAAGLGGAVSKSGEDWIVETAQGPAKISFAPKNDLGVLDHYVTVAPSVEIYVPIRVIPNGSGSEVILTLFRLPEMTDETYANDQKMVERDLNSLKQILER